jgi:hypothetical protein
MGGLAFLTYMITTAPVVSFWDNGEFIAVGYTLGVGHPPGSPVYTLVTRLFSLLPFPNVARAVNFESVLAGALAIALLYFSMVKIARRWEGAVKSFGDGLPTYVTGVTACLFAAFSFSFWENALEAEVYASNIFVMVTTLFLVLRWSELSETPRNRRVLYLVIYLLALGVGTHMGCLLWTPAFLLFVIMCERNYLGVIFLGAPLLLAFVVLSKGIPRGAIGLGLLWVTITLFYAIPALWPKPLPKRRRQGKPKSHPAMLPPALTWTLVIVEVVLLFSTASTKGGGAAGWFFGCLLASAAAVWGFVYLLRVGIVDRPEISARIVLSVVVLGALALSVHAYLLIRARMKPAINEADPHTWKLVLDVIRRRQYEPMRFFPRRTPFSNQFRILWSYYKPQFTVWPLVLAAWGAVAHARKDRRTFAMMAAAFALASIGLLFYLNISDHEVRSREYFWVPSYVGLAIWMGIGSGAIVAWAKNLGKIYRNALVVGLVVFSLIPFAANFRANDRSDNYVAHYYGWNILSFLEKDALLITNGDNDTFPLWYLQQVEGLRNDIEIVNLSLIQINWYIKQLKERGVPMSFTYQQIEQMRPYWARDAETGEPRLITLRDIALHDIIRETGWTRPIYFAVTVDNFMGYDENLKLEGMVFRLVPERARHQVDIEKTYENVMNNYRYDSIVDKENGWRVADEISKTPATRRLITNYAAGFSRLAFNAMQGESPDAEEAMRLYNIALNFAPNYTPALNGLIAIYAAHYLDPDRALPLARQLVETQPQFTESWVRYGGVQTMLAEKLEREGRAAEARPHLEEAAMAYEQALKGEPERAQLYPALASVYQKLGYADKLTSLVEQWRQHAPQSFRAALDASRERAPTGGD